MKSLRQLFFCSRIRKPTHREKSVRSLQHSALIITILSLLYLPAIAAENNKADATEPNQPVGLEKNLDQNFDYVMEGRSDPFAPFITQKTVKPVKPDEIIEENVELTGMRQFEPGQLTLVAVLDVSGDKMAMVEDVTGKGYIIREGTPIGKRGTVSEIKGDQVIIKETAHTRSGRELVNNVTMRLKKEGE